MRLTVAEAELSFSVLRTISDQLHVFLLARQLPSRTKKRARPLLSALPSIDDLHTILCMICAYCMFMFLNLLCT